MTSAEFHISEFSLASKLGLPLSYVRASRGERGVFWEKTANGRIVWSQAGVDALSAGLAKKTAPAATPGLPPAIPVSDAETFTVVRIRTPRVLHVVREGALYDPLRPLNVWLPKPVGHLFRPGMKVLAMARSEHLWDFWGNPAAPEKGRRLPRSFGKW